MCCHLSHMYTNITCHCRISVSSNEGLHFLGRYSIRHGSRKQYGMICLFFSVKWVKSNYCLRGKSIKGFEDIEWCHMHDVMAPTTNQIGKHCHSGHSRMPISASSGMDHGDNPSFKSWRITESMWHDSSIFIYFLVTIRTKANRGQWGQSPPTCEE